MSAPASFAQYREPLIRYFRRRGVPAANVEDLAQECFARIFSLAKRDHIQNEEAYLFQIAFSVLANYLQSNVRHQTRRHVSIDSVEIREETIEVNSPSRVLEGRQAVAKLEAGAKAA
ncbi:MAG: sigma factor [Alphaproteobacteria bacterium]